MGIMDKGLKRIYSRAMKCYQNGLPNKALAYCERGISKDINFAPLLNLKGLILYLQGDLEGCRAVWKIGAELNKDGASKNYLKSCKEDGERLKKYSKAQLLIKEMRISEAIAYLMECQESDFNIINVSNSLTECFIKKGEYIKAEYYIEKVLKIDKKNKQAVNNQAALNKFTSTGLFKKVLKSRKEFLLKGGMVLSGIIIVLAGVFIIKSNFAKEENYFGKITNKLMAAGKIKNDENSQENSDDVNNNSVSGDNINSEKTEENQQKEGKSEAFSASETNDAINNKDFEKLNLMAETFKNEKMSINDQALYNKALEVLNGEGAEFFYGRAMKFHDEKDYERARQDFEISFKYSGENYLTSHIIFMLGGTAEKLQDIESAIKYYELYAKNYLNSEYGDLVLYNLANLNRNINNEEAYKYALMLKEKFPKSMYFNNPIKEILK